MWQWEGGLGYVCSEADITAPASTGWAAASGKVTLNDSALNRFQSLMPLKPIHLSPHPASLAAVILG
ncbi:unnamed protein product [Protopolystoma xenopodis]|uniref:Uncharacterized protein n=1 Tax=Protopolystoma xenopodis TaxID=117903 RepID=A0A3S4ZUJ2_9PLAT|nr:unnamed protein product [Protopolystoma xenopodis]